MLSNFKILPTSVKAVAWINIVGFFLSLIAGIALLRVGPTSEIIKNFLSAFVSLLVIGGILQRSKVVRMFVLVIAWISTALCGFVLVVGLALSGLPALFVVIPLAVSMTTVWGLRTKEAVAYFGSGASGDPYARRDWLGNPVASKR